MNYLLSRESILRLPRHTNAAFGLIKRKDLVSALKQAGFDGPHTGGKHEFMVKGNLRLTLPNPHQGEISKDLLSRI